MNVKNQLPEFGLDTLLEVLLRRAGPHLTPQELEWLGGAGELVHGIASRWRALANDLGVLVSLDAQNGSMACSLQDGESVSQFMFLMSEQFDLLAGLRSVQYGAEVWQSVKQYDREREAVA